MAQLSALAELMQQLKRRRGLMSATPTGAKKSYGSRLFKGRNSMAGLMKERQTISPIMNAMVGGK
jgi:hypothetical protein